MSDTKQKHTPGPWQVESKLIPSGKPTIISGGGLNAHGDGPAKYVLHDRAGIEPADAALICTAPDHALLLAAMVRGVARWEAFDNGDGGEVCVNGFRYATHLDANGCPIVNSAIRRALEDAARPDCGPCVEQSKVDALTVCGGVRRAPGCWRAVRS